MKVINAQGSEPLVFFHGWGFDRHVWSVFIENYFSDRQTHAIDMPGYGIGFNHKATRSLNGLCLILDEVISSPVILIGWSLGGQAAIEFAALFPEKVKKLILISCSPCFIKKDGWPHGVEPEEVINMKKTLRENKEKTLLRFYAQLVKGSDAGKDDLKKLKASDSLSTQALENGLDMLLQEDQRERFNKLKPPVYMCFGTKDPLVDVRLSAACKELNQNIRTCCIDNSGHAPFLFASEQISGWIKQAINGKSN